MHALLNTLNRSRTLHAWRVDVACSATTCGTLVRALRQLTPEGKQRGQPTHLHAIELSQLSYGAFLVWAG